MVGCFALIVAQGRKSEYLSQFSLREQTINKHVAFLFFNNLSLCVVELAMSQAAKLCLELTSCWVSREYLSSITLPHLNEALTRF